MSYFMGKTFLWPILGLFTIIILTLIDRPLWFALNQNRPHFVSYIALIALAISSPIAIAVFVPALWADAVGSTLGSVLSICVGAFLFWFHTVERLQAAGWHCIDADSFCKTKSDGSPTGNAIAKILLAVISIFIALAIYSIL